MIAWTLTFLLLAVFAAVFGFSGLAGTAAGILKLLFWMFLVLFLMTFFFRPPER